MNPITIDVCVVTYRRPELLARLLASLARQQLPEGVSYRVIVVDNDRDRSAAPVIEEARKSGLALVSDVEPEKNVSLARNRSLVLASAEYVAMVDDDAVAPPDWLAQLLATARAYQADAVFGPVERVFPPDAPAHILNCGVFEQPDYPTGATENLIYRTGNTLFRRAVVDSVRGPFDPGFGTTGGEDLFLFHNLQLAGAKVVWCREARVTETVLPERVSIRWTAQRAFREGNTYYRTYREWFALPDKPLYRRCVGLLLWSTKTCVVILTLAVAGVVKRDAWTDAVRLLRGLCRNLGVLAATLGVHYHEYRE